MLVQCSIGVPNGARISCHNMLVSAVKSGLLIFLGWKNDTAFIIILVVNCVNQELSNNCYDQYSSYSNAESYPVPAASIGVKPKSVSIVVIGNFE